MNVHRGVFYLVTILLIFLSISCSENSPTNTLLPQPEQTTINLLNDVSRTFNLLQANENPISIQLLDEQEEPVADVFITFQITGGDGELLLNNERSQSFSTYTNSQGIAEIIWIPGSGIENMLTISVVDMDNLAESIIVGALVQENGDVVLLSCKWLQTNEFQVPYILPPYVVEYNSRVLESNHFLVFSDESPDDIKLDFSASAEDALFKFINAFEISYDHLRIFDTDTKIISYTCKNLYLDNPQMFATDDALFIYGIDSPLWNGTHNHISKKALKHELTHIIQFRMGASYHLCEHWFMEGIAEYMSGGVNTSITNNSQFSRWRSNPDHSTNPIDAKELADLSVPLSRAGEYYGAFHLAVKYLLESNDINRSTADVGDMFLQIAGGVDFTAAFENCFGITKEYFRDNFYDLITDFLNN